MLNDPRVDLSNVGDYVIRLASDNGHMDVVKLLLDDDDLKKYQSVI